MHLTADIIAEDADRWEVSRRPMRNGGAILRLKRLGMGDATVTIALSDLSVVLLEQALAEHRKANTNVSERTER